MCREYAQHFICIYTWNEIGTIFISILHKRTLKLIQEPTCNHCTVIYSHFLAPESRIWSHFPWPTLKHRLLCQDFKIFNDLGTHRLFWPHCLILVSMYVFFTDNGTSSPLLKEVLCSTPMFSASLFTIVNVWNQPSYISGWMDKEKVAYKHCSL